MINIKNVFFVDDGAIDIFSYKEECSGLSIKWGEEENWDDVKKRENIQDYDSFAEFINEDVESERLKWPFSCTVYECPFHFLICKWNVDICEDLRDAVVVPKNFFAVIEFYRDMCLPFLAKGIQGSDDEE